MELVPAHHYTFEQLTEAYNQTRVDYLVPMPMNVARLREYVRVYDIDLANSCVCAEGNTLLGLGMLGVRGREGWITRLGVLPAGRRRGVGSAIMAELLRNAAALGLEEVWLEVIKGNAPAHALFRKFGFTETRELIIARRPPKPASQTPPEVISQVTALDHEEAIILLSHRKSRPSWITHTGTMQNVRNLSALQVELENGGRGWVTYHGGLLQLTRIIVEVTKGDPVEVTETILRLMHHRHKRQDAKTENIPNDAIWQGFKRAGYFDSFRRIEMVKKLGTG
ncbi:MAG: GNAT family N-acetyltransferase [Anaerolineae bacterium]